MFLQILAIVLILNMTGCEREPLESKDQAMRKSSQSIDVSSEDLVAMREGIAEQIEWHKKVNRDVAFGTRVVTSTEYVDLLAGLLVAIDQGEGPGYLKKHFELWEVYGNKGWGNVHLTSYYEPVIEGARQQTERFSEPLLQSPEDLLTIATNKYWEPVKNIGTMRGRLESASNRVVPYFSRAEISQGILEGRGLEIAWVDPIDAFFMQIQGSGTVQADEEIIRVGYANQNGHPYVAIGKFLLGIIPREKMSMQAIREHLNGLPEDERMELLGRNPSFIFFTERKGPAITANTTAVVSGHTIATDARYFPKGTLALLEFDRPVSPNSLDMERKSRLVLDQDTGGAIKGGGRVDLFWGTGVEAAAYAGRINQTNARLAYLVPKSN